MSKTNLVYNVGDKPSWGKTILFAFQQLLAILAATIAVPAIVGNGMSPAAALFGAGVGTIVYLLFTKFKSPVFLGSSFAFIAPMSAAFAGAVSAAAGYLGIIIGAILAGLVYAIIALIVKLAGTAWINKIMPAVVIGPTVAIIGLSLAGNAIGDLLSGSYYVPSTASAIVTDITGYSLVGDPVLLASGEYAIVYNTSVVATSTWIALVVGLITLFGTILLSVFGLGMQKMIPFVIGILFGYAAAAIFTGIGWAANNDSLKVIDFAKFQNIEWVPKFVFIEAFNGFQSFTSAGQFFEYFSVLVVGYVPVAFVVFAEHIADHKNLSSIIGNDLLENPGLHRTLLGDGVGSIAGAFFGGCPNTTYGESVGTVAISRNASIRTILVAALMAIVLSFIGPFATFLSTIPSCVMGGVCIALYGFIAVSGLKMLQTTDLGDNRNLFVVSVVLISGIGGLALTIGKIKLTTVACSLILGILVNALVNIKSWMNIKPIRKMSSLGPSEETPSEEPPAENSEEEPKE
ncbi:MAG: uracil-xanthine permease [Bacilli bacterium]|nr:uracil-xanthine permease [Bacilli bacterium]